MVGRQLRRYLLWLTGLNLVLAGILAGVDAYQAAHYPGKCMAVEQENDFWRAVDDVSSDQVNEKIVYLPRDVRWAFDLTTSVSTEKTREAAFRLLTEAEQYDRNDPCMAASFFTKHKPERGPAVYSVRADAVERIKTYVSSGVEAVLLPEPLPPARTLTRGLLEWYWAAIGVGTTLPFFLSFFHRNSRFLCFCARGGHEHYWGDEDEASLSIFRPKGDEKLNAMLFALLCPWMLASYIATGLRSIPSRITTAWRDRNRSFKKERQILRRCKRWQIRRERQYERRYGRPHPGRDEFWQAIAEAETWMDNPDHASGDVSTLASIDAALDPVADRMWHQLDKVRVEMGMPVRSGTDIEEKN